MPTTAQLDRDALLTFDVDWCPDFVVDEIAGLLADRGVRSTWFATHASPAIDRLAARPDLFELGVHPNFMPGSTHGASDAEVLAHVKGLVPGATSMRTHLLRQSTTTLVSAARDHGIARDVSLFLPRAAHLVPHRVKWYGIDLIRIPYFWEDDSEMFEDDPIFSADHPGLATPGLKVFDFHPIHVALNSERFDRYARLKAERPIRDWDPDLVARHAWRGPGPRTMLLDLARALEAGGGGRFIREVFEPGRGEAS